MARPRKAITPALDVQAGDWAVRGGASLDIHFGWCLVEVLHVLHLPGGSVELVVERKPVANEAYREIIGTDDLVAVGPHDVLAAWTRRIDDELLELARAHHRALLAEHEARAAWSAAHERLLGSPRRHSSTPDGSEGAEA